MPVSMPGVRLRLTEVRLERFKAVLKTERPVEFEAFNALIGRNGAGKSTVIEAVQWIDTALRYDIQAACIRYNGVRDLINLRSTARLRNFRIGLTWTCDDEDKSSIEYSLQIGERADGRTAVIREEKLWLVRGPTRLPLITTIGGERQTYFAQKNEPTPSTYPEKLVLATLFGREAVDLIAPYTRGLRDYWSNAVFLRLSPNELAKPSPSGRLSYEPMLAESGHNLPVLLQELSKTQIAHLVEAIQDSLPSFTGLEVSRPIAPRGEVFFSLRESLPSRGRSGKKDVAIPTWLLSEGTRRITAILAVLFHDPAPTLLCIEEIENGLDPWTVIEIINSLRSSAMKSVQVVITTHSPYLLDNMRLPEITLAERHEGNTTYRKFEDLDAVKKYKGRVPPGAIYASES